MPVEHRFNFPLPNGLHARPASHLEAVASRFRSAVLLVNERTSIQANAKSVLSMVGADVRKDDSVLLLIAGDDEATALSQLRAFLTDVFPTVDEALPSTEVDGQAKLPTSLIDAGGGAGLRGTAVVAGVGIGTVLIVGGLQLPEGLQTEQATDPQAELAKCSAAITAVTKLVESKVQSAANSSEAEVLKAHLSIIRDVSLLAAIEEAVFKSNKTAAQAVFSASEFFAAKLRASESLYLRERVLDIQDVCGQLLDEITGPGQKRPAVKLTGPAVVVADALTPGQFLGLDKSLLTGMVLKQGGTTSHTIILARSMNVPTVVGVAEAMTSLTPGATAVVDGSLGVVIANPTEPTLRYYALEQSKLRRIKAKHDAHRFAPAHTSDGARIEVAANVASAEEVGPAMTGGAEGVGLFRTEMLFLDREAAPSEDEQTEIYTRALRDAGGKPVIIRLFDIGGDKPAPYLDLPEEENPFLGYRGVRLYPAFSGLVKSQLRAILRASVAGGAGPVKIMVPMVAVVTELRSVRVILTEAAAELKADGMVVPIPPLGIMVEVPAAAMSVPQFCREADFFSIGSNDLTQYFLAADRGNPGVTDLYSWAHPSFVRLLRQVVTDAHTCGRWVGLCGEMGDHPAAIPVLVGLGLDEISLSPPRVAATKAAVASLSFETCEALVKKLIDLETRADVDAALADFGGSSSAMPMLSLDLLPRLSATTKGEAIKELCDTLQLAGRVERSYPLEESVWDREKTYSTGFGYGFAVPHCKSDVLKANTIAVGRLKTGVDWGSLDDLPVDVVILLAVRASDHGKEHMRIFSRLSRLVMRDEFRDRVRAEPDEEKLLAFLEENLGLRPVAESV
jgi:phosphoenolpyruvate-protein phosphotransferase